MSSAWIDPRLFNDPKVLYAGMAAIGLWSLSLSYCARRQTDGHIPQGSALAMAGSIERLTELASRLVDAGLWEVAPGGGWVIGLRRHIRFSYDGDHRG